MSNLKLTRHPVRNETRLTISPTNLNLSVGRDVADSEIGRLRAIALHLATSILIFKGIIKPIKDGYEVVGE